MKFLIDESVEKPIVDWLRDQKYDVMYVAESSSGITDEEVIRFANSETRILITNDKDFGELIFRHCNGAQRLWQSRLCKFQQRGQTQGQPLHLAPFMSFPRSRESRTFIARIFSLYFFPQLFPTPIRSTLYAKFKSPIPTNAKE